MAKIGNIPRLYKENTTNFSSAASSLGVLSDAQNCKVTEALNGGFELVLNYPITGVNFDNLRINCVIMAPPNPYDDWQPFRIYKISKPIGGIVTVNAEHKYYELSGYPSMPMAQFKDNPVPCGALMGWMSSEAGRNAYYLSSASYSFTTDISKSEAWEINTPTDLKALMAKAVDLYGGEWKINGTTLQLLAERGEDRHVKVAYGSNLLNIQQDEGDNSYTHLMPFWAKNGEERYLNPPYMSWNGLPATTLPRVLIVDFTKDFDTQPTPAELEAKGQEYIDAHPQKGIEYSQTVRFVSRGQTVEYASLGDIDHVELGDTIGVDARPLDISTSLRCISLTYDVLRGVYESCELGVKKPSITTTQAVAATTGQRDPIVWSAVSQPTKNVKSGDYWVKINNTADMYAQQFSRLDGSTWKVICDFPEIGNTVYVGSTEPLTAEEGDLFLKGYSAAHEIELYHGGSWEHAMYIGGIGESFENTTNERLGDYRALVGNRIGSSFSYSLAAGKGNSIVYREQYQSDDTANFIGGDGNTLTGGTAMWVCGEGNSVTVSATAVADMLANKSSIVAGSGNTAYNIIGCVVFGISCTFGSNAEQSEGSMCGGRDNSVKRAYNSIIAGSSNGLSNHGAFNSLIIGEDNADVSSQDPTAYNSIVAGEGNVAHRNGLTIGTYCTQAFDYTANFGLVVGIGTSDNQRENGLILDNAGNLYIAGHLHQANADYAVCLEWLDGNPNGEDRRGRLVTLDGERLVYADGDDIYGVISAASNIIENAAPAQWQGRYMRDIFGEILRDESGVPKENPAYIPPTQENKYQPRMERKEWDAVAKIGLVVAIDDGTCEVNGYCAARNGIATRSARKTALRVIKRLDATHIKIAIN